MNGLWYVGTMPTPTQQRKDSMTAKKAKQKTTYENLTIPCKAGDPLSRQVKKDVRCIMSAQGFTSIAQALRYAASQTANDIRGRA